MSWVLHYLRASYRDGAREWLGREYDCWSLVREVRHLHYGRALLPSWGHVRHSMPREFTKAYEHEARNMVACEPIAGAIAAAFRGRVMVHVGVIIDIGEGLQVLDINPIRGARRLSVGEFVRQFSRVIFYDDQDLSEQAGR